MGFMRKTTRNMTGHPNGQTDTNFSIRVCDWYEEKKYHEISFYQGIADSIYDFV
jgi:hypothetical protein